ncbi:hypothetical protein PILCRDRAFT_9388 [Piloderma croceum F 1598]|uniref:Uncharacterized protein n=1 Tax=Piloderma croceum (strain F 1598) TaxID=765440 RepID=A0A0C3BT96_PILCF|nr:hypothetical protein PILCRDRAFT_9388 [Piloderma croceum F 1598]
MENNDDEEEEDEAMKLQTCMDYFKDSNLHLTHLQEWKVTKLSCAAMAIVGDEMGRDFLEDFDDMHQEEIEDSFAKEDNIIQNSFLHEHPSLELPDQASRPQGHGNVDSDLLYLSSLVQM